MANLMEELPVNMLVCSVCNIYQECPPPSNSVEVPSCLPDWPAMKCEACCSYRTCISAYTIKVVEARTYEVMMDMAVYNYLKITVEQFDVLCSMDLEV